jgi:dTDP-4-amino-4,6-dideoxygalactose transaminase
MSESPGLAIEGGKPIRTKPFPGRLPFDQDDEREVLEVLRSGKLFFPTGTKVHAFEERFAQLYGVRYAVASTSGTSALHVALGAINPEPGDEVITTPITDMGTVAPIIQQNCIPVFADVDLGTMNITPETVEPLLTDRTRAIIVVHCWGQPADMDGFLALARKHKGLHLIEDCAQAHLTRYKGKLAGTIGDIAGFSLQESKHLRCGDGGVTITDDPKLGDRAAIFVDKGCDWTKDRRYRLKYSFIAPCYRMTDLQGAVLCSQLQKLPWIVQQRQILGDKLTRLLRGISGIRPPKRSKGVEHSYWMFPVLVDWEALGTTREEFGAAMKAEGGPVGGAWIGKALYLYEALAERKAFGTSQVPWVGFSRPEPPPYRPGLCPNAEKALHQLYCFGLTELFTDDDVADIAAAIRKVAEHFAGRKKK